MKKIFYCFILAILLSTFAFSQTYERAKLWDKEIDTLLEIDIKQTPPEKAVLFVGSSSIRLWTNLRESFPNLKFINRGFGGSHLADVNYYFKRIVLPYKPRIIVLFAGENDTWDDVAPEKIASDYRNFSEMVRQNFPKTKIIYISLKPSPSRQSKFDKFLKTNELVKAEVSKDKRAVFVNVFGAMLDEKGQPRPELFKDDMLHMNEKGYEIWRNLLINYLK